MYITPVYTNCKYRLNLIVDEFQLLIYCLYKIYIFILTDCTHYLQIMIVLIILPYWMHILSLPTDSTLRPYWKPIPSIYTSWLCRVTVLTDRSYLIHSPTIHNDILNVLTDCTYIHYILFGLSLSDNATLLYLIPVLTDPTNWLYLLTVHNKCTH